MLAPVTTRLASPEFVTRNARVAVRSTESGLKVKFDGSTLATGKLKWFRYAEMSEIWSADSGVVPPGLANRAIMAGWVAIALLISAMLAPSLRTWHPVQSKSA